MSFYACRIPFYNGWLNHKKGFILPKAMVALQLLYLLNQPYSWLQVKGAAKERMFSLIYQKCLK